MEDVVLVATVRENIRSKTIRFGVSPAEVSRRVEAMQAGTPWKPGTPPPGTPIPAEDYEFALQVARERHRTPGTSPPPDMGYEFALEVPGGIPGTPPPRTPIPAAGLGFALRLATESSTSEVTEERPRSTVNGDIGQLSGLEVRSSGIKSASSKVRKSLRG
jgi:hypothetical protein